MKLNLTPSLKKSGCALTYAVAAYQDALLRLGLAAIPVAAIKPLPAPETQTQHAYLRALKRVKKLCLIACEGLFSEALDLPEQILRLDGVFGTSVNLALAGARFLSVCPQKQSLQKEPGESLLHLTGSLEAARGQLLRAVKALKIELSQLCAAEKLLQSLSACETGPAVTGNADLILADVSALKEIERDAFLKSRGRFAGARVVCFFSFPALPGKDLLRIASLTPQRGPCAPLPGFETQKKAESLKTHLAAAGTAGGAAAYMRVGVRLAADFLSAAKLLEERLCEIYETAKPLTDAFSAAAKLLLAAADSADASGWADSARDLKETLFAWGDMQKEIGRLRAQITGSTARVRPGMTQGELEAALCAAKILPFSDYLIELS